MTSGSIFLAVEHPLTDQHAEACAARLLTLSDVSACAITGGGNNRIYRIDSPAGTHALKFYPTQQDDPRDRLGQEYAALSFLNRHGVRCVPTPVSCDNLAGAALYEWVDGEAPGAARDQDIDAMAAFAGALAELAQADDSALLVNASASCFSGADAVGQFTTRLNRLRDIADEPELLRFLDDALFPSMRKIEKRARKLYLDAGISFDAPLAQAERTLSPSDFGLHNTRRGPDGTIRFLDFEYFGWDDPVKMISDVCWHPGSALEDRHALQFRNALADTFSKRNGKAFHCRLEALFPIFGAIWCLIILNEFLPERWSRRVAAGITENAKDARVRQLQRARIQLQKVSESFHD